MYNIRKLKNIIKPMLSEKRYRHSVLVGEMAKEIATYYGDDANLAQAGGILHDITKDMPFDEQLKILNKFGIILTDIEQSSKSVWHQISGGVYVEKVLGFNDQELIGSVRYHTTGKYGMTNIEKIVFLADATSLDRKYKDVDKLRKAIKIDLDYGMIVATKFSIQSCIKKEQIIVPETIETYNEAIKNYKKKGLANAKNEKI